MWMSGEAGEIWSGINLFDIIYNYLMVNNGLFRHLGELMTAHI
jgi:hypothetical protein